MPERQFIGPKYTDRSCLEEDASLRLHPGAGDEKYVTVYGVTNRPLDANGNPTGQSSTDRVQYYVAKVPVHRRDNDYLAFNNRAQIKMVSQEEFDNALEKQTTVSGILPRVGIYVHGVLQNTDEVIHKAAEISANSNETIVIEDWDTGRQRQEHTESKLKQLILLGKNTSEETRAKCEPLIDNSINHLTRKFGAQNVDLIAHSHGSTFLLDYLSRKQQSGFRSVTFAHPDFPESRLIEQLQDITNCARTYNIMYDPEDRLLNVLKRVSAPPVGLGRPELQTELQKRAHGNRPLLPPGLSPVDNNRPYYIRMVKDVEKNGISGDPMGHDFSSQRAGDLLRLGHDGEVYCNDGRIKDYRLR